LIYYLHLGTLHKDVCAALDMDSVSVEIVGLEDILKLLSRLSYPSTLHKDVCGALSMDYVSVDVVGLEET